MKVQRGISPDDSWQVNRAVVCAYSNVLIPRLRLGALSAPKLLFDRLVLDFI